MHAPRRPGPWAFLTLLTLASAAQRPNATTTAELIPNERHHKAFYICKVGAECFSWPARHGPNPLFASQIRDQLDCNVIYLDPSYKHRYQTEEILKIHASKYLCETIKFMQKRNKKRIPRQTAPRRGKFRGQTQSQYLNIGGNDNGKAEAQSSADSSRAVVSGKSGMGQAQSQSMFDPCEDCLGSKKSDFGGKRLSPDGQNISDQRHNFDVPYTGGIGNGDIRLLIPADGNTVGNPRDNSQGQTPYYKNGQQPRMENNNFYTPRQVVDKYQPSKLNNNNQGMPNQQNSGQPDSTFTGNLNNNNQLVPNRQYPDQLDRNFLPIGNQKPTPDQSDYRNNLDLHQNKAINVPNEYALDANNRHPQGSPTMFPTENNNYSNQYSPTPQFTGAKPPDSLNRNIEPNYQTGPNQNIPYYHHSMTRPPEPNQYLPTYKNTGTQQLQPEQVYTLPDNTNNGRINPLLNRPYEYGNFYPNQVAPGQGIIQHEQNEPQSHIGQPSSTSFIGPNGETYICCTVSFNKNYSYASNGLIPIQGSNIQGESTYPRTEQQELYNKGTSVPSLVDSTRHSQFGPPGSGQGIPYGSMERGILGPQNLNNQQGIPYTGVYPNTGSKIQPDQAGTIQNQYGTGQPAQMPYQGHIPFQHSTIPYYGIPSGPIVNQGAFSLNHPSNLPAVPMIGKDQQMGGKLPDQGNNLPVQLPVPGQHGVNKVDLPGYYSTIQPVDKPSEGNYGIKQPGQEYSTSLPGQVPFGNQQSGQSPNQEQYGANHFGQGPAQVHYGSRSPIQPQGQNGPIFTQGTNSQSPTQAQYGQIPTQGAYGQIPTQGQYGQMPNRGPTSQILNQGRNSQLPSQGQNNQFGQIPIPQGQYGQIPSQVQNPTKTYGQSSQNPTLENTGQIPNQGKSGIISTQGQYGRIPTQDQYGQIPTQGPFGSMPNQGQNSQIPNQGQNSQIPYQGQHGQTPSIGPNSQIPYQGQYGNMPNQGQNNQIPYQGEYGQTPSQGRNSQVPTQGQYGQMPTQGPFSQMPNQGQNSQIPNQGQMPTQDQYGQIPSQGQNPQMQGQHGQLPTEEQYVKMPSQGQVSPMPTQGQYGQVPIQGQTNQYSQIPTTQNQYGQVPSQVQNNRNPTETYGQNSLVPTLEQNGQIPKQGQHGQISPQGQPDQLATPNKNSLFPLQGQYPTLGQNGMESTLNPSDPNSITTDTDESEAQASISGDHNGTIAIASSKGGNDKGTANTQVQGTYTGTGSFSAQAQISDGDKGAESQVSGNKDGATSNAIGKGKNNKSQANVQLGSERGSLQTQAQSEGNSHSSKSQVQGGAKGGMADAQARGLGSTSSQAQIGFTPYKDSDTSHNDMKASFVGGGSASAQSNGRMGQSQSQLQGTFKLGITYNGAAQAGSSIDKDAVFENRTIFPRKDYAEGEKEIEASTEIPLPVPPLETNANDMDHPHSAHHKDVGLSKTTTPIDGTRSINSHGPIREDYDYGLDREENTTDDYDTEGGDPPEYYDEYPKETKVQKQFVDIENQEKLDIKQIARGNTQHITSGNIRGHDAEVVQKSFEPEPDYNHIYQPGERVPGTGGYVIPKGFTGSVQAISSKDRTEVYGSRNSGSQAQTISLTPGTGQVKYINTNPSTYPKTVKSKELKSLTNNEQEDASKYMTVTKSVTGALDGDNKIKKEYSHTYYTKSSSCGFFTFSCTMVSGTNGTRKVCKPKIPTNPDGTPMKC